METGMTPHQLVEGLLDRILASDWKLSADFAQRLASLVGGTIGPTKALPTGEETLVVMASPYNWRVRTKGQETAVLRASLSFEDSDDHQSDTAAQKMARTTFKKCAASITKKIGTPLTPTRSEQEKQNAAQLEVTEWSLRDAIVLLELKHEDRELPYEVALSFRWSKTLSRLSLPKTSNGT